MQIFVFLFFVAMSAIAVGEEEAVRGGILPTNYCLCDAFLSQAQGNLPAGSQVYGCALASGGDYPATADGSTVLFDGGTEEACKELNGTSPDVLYCSSGKPTLSNKIGDPNGDVYQVVIAQGYLLIKPMVDLKNCHTVSIIKR